MAFLGGIQDFFTGSEGLIDAQQGAAQATIGNIEQAQQNIDPLSALLGKNLPALQQGATIEGFDQNIQGIEGSDAFSRLLSAANRNAGNQLSQAGLSRSGRAATVGNETALNTLMGLEGMLNQRRGGLVDRGTQGAFAQNDLLSALSGARSAQLVGPAQTQATARGNTINSLLGIADIASGFGGVGAGRGIG